MHAFSVCAEIHDCKSTRTVAFVKTADASGVIPSTSSPSSLAIARIFRLGRICGAGHRGLQCPLAGMTVLFHRITKIRSAPCLSALTSSRMQRTHRRSACNKYQIQPAAKVHMHLNLHAPAKEHVHVNLYAPAKVRMHLNLYAPAKEHMHVNLHAPAKDRMHLNLHAPAKEHMHLNLHAPAKEHMYVNLHAPAKEHMHAQPSSLRCMHTATNPQPWSPLLFAAHPCRNQPAAVSPILHPAHPGPYQPAAVTLILHAWQEAPRVRFVVWNRQLAGCGRALTRARGRSAGPVAAGQPAVLGRALRGSRRLLCRCGRCKKSTRDREAPPGGT
eukprot:366249-Chlamydomonas_euryale.AAC.5